MSIKFRRSDGDRFRPAVVLPLALFLAGAIIAIVYVANYSPTAAQEVRDAEMTRVAVESTGTPTHTPVVITVVVVQSPTPTPTATRTPTPTVTPVVVVQEVTRVVTSVVLAPVEVTRVSVKRVEVTRLVEVAPAVTPTPSVSRGYVRLCWSVEGVREVYVHGVGVAGHACAEFPLSESDTWTVRVIR